MDPQFVAARKRLYRKIEKDKAQGPVPTVVPDTTWTREETTGRLMRCARVPEPVHEPVPHEPVPHEHPEGWSSKDHYMLMGWCWCGQSCPCCRARVGDTLGACPICISRK